MRANVKILYSHTAALPNCGALNLHVVSFRHLAIDSVQIVQEVPIYSQLYIALGCHLRLDVETVCEVLIE